ELGLAFSPDGKTLAVTASARDAVELIDLGSWKVVASLKRAVNTNMRGLAFSPDGKTLAVGTCPVVLWDVAGRRKKGQLGNDSSSTALAAPRIFFLEGGAVLAEPVAGDVRLWSVDGGAAIAYGTSSGRLAPLAASPDGKRLASATPEYAAKVWDIVPALREWKANPRPRLSLLMPEEVLAEAAALSADGKAAFAAGGMAAIGAKDGALVSWNAGEPKLAKATERITALSASADGTRVLSIGKRGLFAGPADSIRLWHGVKRKELASLKGEGVRAAVLGPDGKLAAAVGTAGVLVWDLPGGKLRRTIAHAVPAEAPLAFAPDGKTLAVPGEGKRVEGEEIPFATHHARLLDPLAGKSGAEIGKYDGAYGATRALAFSPDGKKLFGLAQGVFAWEAASGKRLFAVREKGQDKRLAVGGRFLAVADDETVRLLDAGDGKELAKLRGTERCLALAFSADGRTLLVLGGTDGTTGGATAVLWDIPEGFGRKK
ncbi:MAG: WD40 repeat domain-containing protein, partial [Gemmataceae bacterium]|nr:WD40 repeat domain-containing protein [Gemmataceae bacterium]